MAATPDVRTGQGDVKLSREEFERRLRERFYDRSSTRRRWRSATSSMRRGRPTTSITMPRVREAGPGFANPAFTLPVEWLDARDRIHSAERQHRDPAGRSRVLLVAGAAGARGDRAVPVHLRSARSEPAHRPVRTPDPALQGVRVDGHAAVPLAVLLLSEPRDGPGERLDETRSIPCGWRPTAS